MTGKATEKDPILKVDQPIRSKISPMLTGRWTSFLTRRVQEERSGCVRYWTKSPEIVWLLKRLVQSLEVLLGFF